MVYASPMRARAPLPAARAHAAAKRASEWLAKDPRVRLVYLYGSSIGQPEVGARDVDIGVLTDPPLDLEQLTHLRADVVAHARADVDLVSLNDASVVLAHEIVESGRCLYADPPEAEVDFVTRVRARYWDFKPFRDEQWRLAGERLAERRGGS